ncbi:host-nuclease inhibitor Gam family protein [Staphylococcus xylosus]|uniref:host-nuclease inhibitor Gam family protein n=1 Tax=Staphylococcus xylosus TaxID=1288 RepID=UPI001C3F0041|nr:host-nuclease inhibitor Gam family protein [Staphylococcus xylosus]
MNKLQLEEIDTLEKNHNETFKINNLETANWAFKKIDALQAKEKEISNLAEQEIERINTWQEKELAGIGDSKAYFQHLLTEYYREQREKNSKFKLSTPYGKVTSRKGAKVIQCSSELNTINLLKSRGLDNYIKTSEKLDQSAIKKDFNETDGGTLIDPNGEVIEGIYLVQKPTSYSVKLGG